LVDSVCHKTNIVRKPLQRVQFYTSFVDDAVLDEATLGLYPVV